MENNQEAVEEKGLVIVDEKNALDIFTSEKGLDPLLDKIKKEVSTFVPDVSTKKGRDEIKKMVTKVVSSKTYLEGVGKKLVDELKEKPNLINKEKRRIKDILDDLRDSVRKPLTEWEDTEKQRKENHYSNIEAIKNLKSECKENSTVSEINQVLEKLRAIVVDESWEEFEEAGASWHEDLMTYLRERINTRESYENQQRELIVLRKEKEEREAREKATREEQEKKDRELELDQKAKEEAVREAARHKKMAEEAKEKAARVKKEAEEKAERDRIAQEEKVKRDKEEAARKAEIDKQKAVENERRRIEAEEEKKKAEEAKRQANLEHQKTINNVILDKLEENGFSSEIAKKIIGLAATGQVGNLIVKY